MSEWFGVSCGRSTYLKQRNAVDSSRKAEIRHLYHGRIVRREKHVLGLEVAMYYPLGMYALCQSSGLLLVRQRGMTHLQCVAYLVREILGFCFACHLCQRIREGR